MDVIGCDISELDEKKLKTETGISRLVNNYDSVIDKADYISIHLPSLPSTRHFIDEDFLAKLRPDSFLINTSRGPIVDEAALFDVLKDKKIAGAALDVFEEEPYMPVNPDKDLRTLGNTILTPHVGSSTVEACKRMALGCLKNIKAAIKRNYDQLDILNPKVLDKVTQTDRF